jgi:hypothetical protein
MATPEVIASTTLEYPLVPIGGTTLRVDALNPIGVAPTLDDVAAIRELPATAIEVVEAISGTEEGGVENDASVRLTASIARPSSGATISRGATTAAMGAKLLRVRAKGWRVPVPATVVGCHSLCRRTEDAVARSSSAAKSTPSSGSRTFTRRESER